MLALFLAARALLEAGREEEALSLASELASRLQPHPRAYARLIQGEVELKRGQARRALDEFQKALELADTWLGRFDLGRAYLELEAFTEAHSELELCIERRGEATAVFLDDVPSYSHFPPVLYHLARVQEGLKSPRAIELYRDFVEMKSGGEGHLLDDARKRLSSLERDQKLN